MFKNLVSLAASPLTKYMAIAIAILISALGAALYLTYDLYGDKKVAEAFSVQLEVAVEEERKQTEKVVKGSELIRETVTKVREGDKALNKASEGLQKQALISNPNNPIGESKYATESITGCSGDYLSPSDIRLLQHAHCLTDGDASDCN